jgi:glycosyltransferase involved in cell wall biosynthesis
MRVLQLPTTVGGHSSGLSRELRGLGVESEVWTVVQNYLQYPVDREISTAEDSLAIRLLKMLRAGAYLFGRWDIVHFNFGSTLYSTWHSSSPRSGPSRILGAALNGAAFVLSRFELAVLKLRHVPVFVHYQGDDARQGDYSRTHYEISIANQVGSDYYNARSDRWKRAQVRLFARHAARIYAVNPDLMNVLPGRAVFLPYGHVRLSDYEPRFTQADRDRVVLAHAPSNRAVKGTDLILDALRELAEEGYDFDLDLIEGLSNDEALARYAAADVVIDQLYAGWYGGVAVEAMAMGKPVAVYLRESDFRHLPSEMVEQLPFFRATPQTIKADLRAILDEPRQRLLERARKSRAFVEQWHDPEAIARRVIDDYREARSRGRRATWRSK